MARLALGLAAIAICLALCSPAYGTETKAEAEANGRVRAGTLVAAALLEGERHTGKVTVKLHNKHGSAAVLRTKTGAKSHTTSRARNKHHVSTDMNVKVYTGKDAQAQLQLFSALEMMGTVAVSADADASQTAILNEPEVKAALAAKQPDAVDKLIQGILDGSGQGGVVTSEFNQNGVHATIISNVNELRITQLDGTDEELIKRTAEQRRKSDIVERDKVQA